MNRVVVITGANRGIGLALAEQYQMQGDKVIAVCRQSSQALAKLAGVTIIENVDVVSDQDLLTLAKALTGIDVDLLINNAGILSEEFLGDIDFDAVERQFRVNAIGPLKATEALLNNLHSGAKVVLVTSRMGSLGDNGSGGHYGYRMSKSALNSAAVSLAVDLKPKGIAVALLHPGFVQTALVNNQGNVSADQAAEMLIQRIDALSIETTGSFTHANGEALPW